LAWHAREKIDEINSNLPSHSILIIPNFGELIIESFIVRLLGAAFMDDVRKLTALTK